MGRLPVASVAEGHEGLSAEPFPMVSGWKVLFSEGRYLLLRKQSVFHRQS